MGGDIFNRVMNDNISGSGAIVNRVQKTLLELANSGNPIRQQDLHRGLKRLRTHFPQFGVLFHFMKSLDKTFRGKDEIQNHELERFVLNYRHEWAGAQKKAIQRFCNEIGVAGKTVLLHSNSSSIHHLFRKVSLQHQKTLIYQTLSSPANEGLVQARGLSKMGFEVRLFHEDALSKHISNIDFAILGADLILDETFLNKIGSFPISLLCKHFNKPVYVLADRRKKIDLADISARDLQLFNHEDPKPTYEITRENIENTQIINEYFEFTPLNLIEKLFL